MMVFVFAGMIKGMIGLGLPAVSMGLDDCNESISGSISFNCSFNGHQYGSFC
jgi:hypothetical protein